MSPHRLRCVETTGDTADAHARARQSTPAYQLDVDAVLAAWDTSGSGLTAAEADRRLAESGPNSIVAQHKRSPVREYLGQFADPMIILLLVSGAVSAYLGEPGTAIVLVLLVLFNTAIGFAQEFRAGKSLEALENLLEPTCEVIRDGSALSLDSSRVVPGDVVVLDEGGAVPADVRLIWAEALSTNDFALTGESVPATKFLHPISGTVPVAKRHNLAYAGTTVATGQARGVVIATAGDTEFGRIAALSQSVPDTRSPLQREIGHLARTLTSAILVIAVILMIIAMAADMAFKEAMLFAVGVAGALIPQGLPAEVNTALAQAASTLAKAKALVKRLSAVETLGATAVICTDKTGTLTKNEMTVIEYRALGEPGTVSGTGYAPEGELLIDGSAVTADRSRAWRDWFLAMALPNSAGLHRPDAQHPDWYVIGDPTEGALLTLVAKAGLDRDRMLSEYRYIRELPFDSARKLMTAIREHDGRTVAYTKGAPESVLAACTHIRDADGVRPLTDDDRAEFSSHIAELAGRALRNLALAVRELDDDTRARVHSDGPAADHTVMAAVEQHMTLLGTVSMIDPVRDQVPDAMAAARGAHINVNILTGDAATTAAAIATRAGLGEPGELTTISADDFDAMSDDEIVRHALSGSTVFARVAPEDKMRIVDLVKKSGNVVAVTGDGVNDAPALKHADIGVAMGRSGTDVAKQSAEMILLDDSFATLVRAVSLGRTVYANITKGVLSCLTSNAAELVVNLVSLVLSIVAGVPLAINVLQILAIDVLGELFPIAAIGTDRQEGELMRRAPRDPRSHILSARAVADLAWCGLVVGAITIGNYLLFYDRHGVNPFADDVPDDVVWQATTVTYVSILLCQLVNIIQRRSIHGFFTRYQFHNAQFWWAMGAGIAIMLVIVYVPVVADFFQCGPLDAVDWLFVLGGAVIFLAVREAQRIVFPAVRRPPVDNEADSRGVVT